MTFFSPTARLALIAPFALLAASAATAGVGDLLVAPTRIVLNGSRGTQIILNNIGDDVATYRISVELRRMTTDGSLVDVAAPSAAEKAAEEMILYAPRKVTLPPNQPQTINIAARAPAGLADGEYRVHLLFRAIPKPRPVTAEQSAQKGISFALTPVYGVTIPLIVRLGNLQAKAGIAGVHLVKEGGKPAVALDLTRSGSRSTFGEVRVMKAGIKDPIAIQRGVAVYTEVSQRSLSIPVNDKLFASASGPVTVQYVETSEAGPQVIAETGAVLR
ncbi:MAG: molecular chaperone [Sphingomicrobium sp.]